MKEYTLDELSKEEQEKLLADVVTKRIARTHARGVPTTHSDNNGLYHLYPDGRKVYIKDEEKKKVG